MSAVLDIPFDKLLPPLSTEEGNALEADIKENGVQHRIFVDEDGEILDGRHRYKIDPNAPRKIIKGLTKAEKCAFVFRVNFARRNLSSDQKRDALKKMKQVAFALRAEDAKKNTQKRVAMLLGVARSTVETWFADKTTTNDNVVISCTRPDARVKINQKQKPVIAELIANGQSQEQVAADYGVTQQAISKIVKAEEKKATIAKEREEAAKTRKGNCGVITGDFRIGSAAIEDESVDLIFTDPPYDESSASLYADIAKLAATKLAKGGWLLAYTGQFHLPAVIKAFSESDGLNYAWMFAVLHSGGDQRIRKYKLLNGWKPIVAAFRPPLAISWEWFRDCVTGGKEKDDHEWQQAESEASHFIERLCPKNGLVFDPCCGSGTTLLAAKVLGRKWFGYEVDNDTAEKARSRLS